MKTIKKAVYISGWLAIACGVISIGVSVLSLYVWVSTGEFSPTPFFTIPFSCVVILVNAFLIRSIGSVNDD